MLDKILLECILNELPKTYDGAAVLQLEIAKRMGERLDYIKQATK